MLNPIENPWSIQSIYEFQYFNCPICQFKDQSKQDFVNHAFQDHPESIAYLLDVGDGSLDDVDFPTSIKDEGKTLAPSEGISFHEESKTQENEEKLDVEDFFEEQLEEPDFKCNVCLEFFDGGQSLLDHVDSMHNNRTKDKVEKKDYDEKTQFCECDICREPFGSKLSLANHLRTSHQFSITTICDSCGTKFETSEDKETHKIDCKLCQNKITKLKEAPQKKYLFPEKEKDRLKCEPCDTIFYNYFKISQHMYRCHKPNKRFNINQSGTICMKCQKDCSDYDTLRAHLFVDHITDCIICQKNFATTELLIIHLLEIHKRMEFSCITCGLFFESEKYKLEHMKNCSELFKCAFCPYNVASRKLYKAHIRRIHWNEILHQCEKCERTFNTNPELVNHVQRIHEKKDMSVKCELCGKMFANRNGMKTHIRFVHQKIRKFSCEKCAFQTTNSASLRQHTQQVHEKIKNFKCDQCGKEFFNKTQHDSHYRNLHESHISKSHQCDKCEKSFWSQSRLNEHFDSIHGEKKFQCDKCEKSYAMNNRLQTHIKTIHEKTEIFKCKECGKEFNRSDNHDTHVKVVHRGIKDFKCEHCGKEFARKKYLEKHLQTCQNLQS